MPNYVLPDNLSISVGKRKISVFYQLASIYINCYYKLQHTSKQLYILRRFFKICIPGLSRRNKKFKKPSRRFRHRRRHKGRRKYKYIHKNVLKLASKQKQVKFRSKNRYRPLYLRINNHKFKLGVFPNSIYN